MRSTFRKLLVPPKTSLRQKVMFLVMGLTAMALMVGATAFLTFEDFASRKSDARALSSLAEIISVNLALPVTFDDAGASVEVLKGLKAHGHITEARVYSASGAMLTSYPALATPASRIRVGQEDRVWFEAGRICASKRIYTPEGRIVGSLFLEMDQADRGKKMAFTTLFLLGVLTLVGLPVWFLGRRWAHVITAPVRDLADVAFEVSQTADFSLRARAVPSNDEMAVLVHAFNGMLERIQEQDERLEDHRWQLERQVAARTAELVSANNELLVAKERADVSNKAKSAFLANMSHELRTPLNAILLYSELIREESEEAGHEGILADAQRIETSGRHLLSLINDVLDLSKIEAGKMTLNRDSIEILPLIKDVLGTVGPLAAQNGNTLELEAAPALGTMVSDATKMRQSLFNLLSNACKFTQQGRITVRAYLAKAEGYEDEWLHIAVEDTGIGISPEQQTRIFHEFIQAQENTTRQYGGTGLGLALSRRFCQLLGGDIRLHSVLGQGSIFTIVLPLTFQEPAPEAPAPVVEKAAPLPNQGPILLIDDDPFLLNALTRLLMLDGHQVVAAHDGIEGLRLAAEIHPGLILLDVTMPQVDGWTVLKALKADPALAEIPVVMLTILEEVEKGLALGASDYLFKPIDHAHLSGALKRFRLEHAPGRVLVVDDDVESQQLLQRSLLAEGWDSWPALDGRAALDQLRLERPSLILLDLLMPGMDGFSFLAEKQQHPAWGAIPVIVVTARDLTAKEREQLRQAQVAAVLQKGLYTKVELVDEVRRAVQRGLAGNRKGVHP
ncbi:response regulator [Geothrix sp. PMB-07]|uniref:response regulator n=1 Tax=Geothrix sp. PMB-07 TaxID=3068640 RepID=UPI002740676F|nr:response regulator [Geothrix sp. PMB-07]WLT31222.1 response regulator [Geothrix sp. PMB-07]